MILDPKICFNQSDDGLIFDANGRSFNFLELQDLDGIQRDPSREGSAEVAMWCTVLLRLYDDYRIAYAKTDKSVRQYKLRFLNNYLRSKDFNEVCVFAGVSPIWFRSRLRKKFPNNFDCFLRKVK